MTTRTRGVAAALLLLLSTQAFALGTAKPQVARKPATKHAVAPRSPITISLSHRMRRGSLVVLLNGAPIFNEQFDKPIFVISQTTTWNPVEAPPGKYRLTAQVNGKNGKTYQSGIYEIELSRKGADIKIRMKGDHLTIDQTS